MEIIKMSLSASVLILVAIIIRALVLHRLPKVTFLALWAMALCRLLIPISIPSHFSFFSLVDILKTRFSAIDVIVPDINPSHIINTSLLKSASVSFAPLIVVWLLGLSACALFFLITHLLWLRKYKTALPVDNEIIRAWQQTNPTGRKVEIKQSDKITASLTYGILHPVVLLPKVTDWKDETKLRYILTHEFVHIRRFDTLRKLVLAVAVCVHWFNPLVWVMFILANRDIELSCDAAVIRAYGETIKSAYALTLIRLVEKKSILTPLTNGFSKNAIEERITAIMKSKKYSIPAFIVAILLVVGVTVAFTTSYAATDNIENGKDDVSVSGNVGDTAYYRLERALEEIDYISTAKVSSVSRNNPDDFLHIDLTLDGTTDTLNKEQVAQIQKLANTFNDADKPLNINVVGGICLNTDLSGYEGGEEVAVSAPAYQKSPQ